MEFFKFNKIYVIESLLGERQTGKELYDDIIKRRSYYHRYLSTEFVQVLSLEDWGNIIKRIKQETKDNHIIPILHFELHGSSNHDELIHNMSLSLLAKYLPFCTDSLCSRNVAAN